MKNTIDIILPCYNPHEKWDDNVIESFEKLKNNGKKWELRLIIVNDGSTKGINPENILKIKEAIPNFTYISYKINKGKGYALRKGVEKSSADYIILTDIDFPYTHSSMVNIMKELTTNDIELLAGERDINYYKKTPYLRKLISKMLKYFVKKLLKIPVSDTQCGLKGFNNNIKDIFLITTINRYLYDIEFLWLASKKNKVSSFPVQLKNDIIFSKMNYKILLVEGFNFIKLFVKTILSK